MVKPRHKKAARLLACLALASWFVVATRDSTAQTFERTLNAHDLAILRDISSLSISPDERWAAFLIVQADPECNCYDTSWRVMTIGERNGQRLADGGELAPSASKGRVVEYRPPSAPAWSPNSVWLAYLRRENGSTQIWRLRRDGEIVEQVTHNPADVLKVVYARDGRQLLFETEPSQAQISEALAVEGRSGFRYDERFQPIYERIPVFPKDTSFLGEAVGESHTQTQISARRIWAYDFSNDRERPATEAEQVEFAALTAQPRPQGRPAFRTYSAESPGGALAWTEARDSERQGLDAPLTVVALPAGAHEPIVCEAPECTANKIAGLWWRGERQLIFVRREGFRLQDRALYAWRPSESRAPRLILRTPDLFASPNPGCAIAQDRLVCLYEQPNYPGRLVAIDLDNGAMETLYDPNPDFARFNLGPPPQRIAIRATSGADTFGYLVLTPRRRAGERLPLIIVTYRCSGFLRGGVGDEYPIYPFAAEGFAVLCFDAPDDLERRAQLDGGSYNRWVRGPGVPERRRVEDTLVAAIAQLDEMGVIDPDRVGLTGLSFGAEIVGFALPHMPRLAAAITSGHPGPGPGSYSLLGPLVRNTLRVQSGVGAPSETPERWREIGFSPNVERVRAPLLINVADHEMMAALEPVTALEDAGRAVEMYVFPNEFHIKWQPAHRLAIYERNIDWMNFWLRGIEDSDPAKAEQYRRWRRMRENVAMLRRGGSLPPRNKVQNGAREYE